jgi:hypothetical protein
MMGKSMTSYGKLNLLGMFGMPVFAVVGALIIFGTRTDTLVFVFGTNLAPMLIGGLVSALLIRAANKAGNKKFLIALSPTLVPAAFGVLWYLIGLFNLGAGDSGSEFFAGPLYLVAWVVAASVIAPIVYKVTPSSAA